MKPSKLEPVLENTEIGFGRLPKTMIGDGIFWESLEPETTRTAWDFKRFQALGKPPASDQKQKHGMKKKQRLRNGHMEGIIGHAKNPFWTR